MPTPRKKILIADSDPQVLKSLANYSKAGHCVIQTAQTGPECLLKIETFEPDLVFVEMFLPQIHGMDILRRIKANPRLSKIGVIVTTSHIMIQNYQAAVNLGCAYFLEKPFTPSEVFALFRRYFEGKLKPGPFSGKQSTMKGAHCYLPKMHAPNSYIKFWGTRGSNPVSGPDYARFGGSTSCLEIRHGNDLLIVDAGTGIRPLGTELAASRPKKIHLLISHTHWDHVAGFPFFPPLYDPDCQITIWTPIGFEKSTREIFTEMLSYAYFPVRLDDIKATVIFKEFQEGIPLEIGSISINTHYAFHPGSTLCFKFKVHKTTFGYATDNEFLMGYHGNPKQVRKSSPLITPYKSMVSFFSDCNFLIHEAQYTPAEYQTKVGWGHSSITNATALILLTEMREWIITHHDPKHTDPEMLKKMQMQYDVFDGINYACRPRMAFDGMTIPI
jgi:phosphoribosyl 1,2-cyclic phosphodiesterase/DNA-binding NarL/FixJ family response regulator